MSRKDAFAFLRKVAGDNRLREKIKSLEQQSILMTAEEEGFSFTLDELRDVNEEIRGTSDELSDELMEMVVGGLSTHEGANWFENNIDRLRTVYDDLSGNLKSWK